MIPLLLSIIFAVAACTAVLVQRFHIPMANEPKVTSSSETLSELSALQDDLSSNFEINSIASSAASSQVSSAVSSKAASSKPTASKAAAKPKAVVPTKAQLKAAAKVIPTKAERAAEDPEAKKVKSSAPVKNSVNVSSSTVSSSKPVSSSNSASLSSSSSSANHTDGWKIVNGVKYFYYQNNPLTGWQTIEGKKYNFDSTGALKTRLGIDVSEYQGTIDWKKVKAAGVDFAIIRAGWRGYGSGSYNKDSCFEQNYNGAKAAGISVGVYFFSQAISVEEAAAEAQYTLDILNGRSVSEPIAIDIEGISDPTARTNTANLTNQQRTDIAIAFYQKISSSGSTSMIYSGKYYFYNRMNVSQLAPYTVWVAQYLDDPTIGTTFAYPYKYWQYCSDGSIDGISGRVDMDISF